MKKSIIILAFMSCITIVTSCKKDYSQLASDFISNLPDSCTLLTQIDEEQEHAIYFKAKQINSFFCHHLESEETDTINIPKVDYPDCHPSDIFTGKENIMVGYKKGVENIAGSHVYVQLYNLKKRSFRKLLDCSWYQIDEAKKQITCLSYDTDENGDGSCTIDVFDFDGNTLMKKVSEIYEHEFVPDGTLAAKKQEEAQKAQAMVSKQTIYEDPVYYCELCGAEYSNIESLTRDHCIKNGSRGNHVLYEGSPKDEYTCKYCGTTSYSIRSLVNNRCIRRPGHLPHVPAL